MGQVQVLGLGLRGGSEYEKTQPELGLLPFLIVTTLQVQLGIGLWVQL